MSNYAIDTLNNVYTTPIMKPGSVVDVDGVSYRYVFNSSTTTAITAYYPAYIATTDGWDCVGASASGLNTKIPVGVAHTEIGTREYGFVAYHGVHTYHATTSATECYNLQGVAEGLGVSSATTDFVVGVVVYGTAAAGNAVAYLNM